MDDYVGQAVLSQDGLTFGCIIALVHGIALVQLCDGRSPIQRVHILNLQDDLARARALEA